MWSRRLRYAVGAGMSTCRARAVQAYQGHESKLGAPNRRPWWQSRTARHARRRPSASSRSGPKEARAVAIAPHEHRQMHAGAQIHLGPISDRRGPLVPNQLNSLEFSNGYGGPDSWFESSSLGHELSNWFISYFYAGWVRILTRIPGLCDVLTISTVCTETIFFDIEGICVGMSHLRLCGGTAVSRAMRKILASEPDSKT